MTKACKEGEWQYDATVALKAALQHLDIEAEEVPIKSDMKRWFRLFATLRNKTRAHGAPQPEKTTKAAEHIAKSIELVYRNFRLFRRPWAHLYRNMNGRFRVSGITDNIDDFAFLKQAQDKQFPNGIYLFMGSPRRVCLMHTESELRDFFFANGGLTAKKFEMLSYYSDDKVDGDGSAFLTPPGVLPPSETEGHGELIPRGNCFSNVPDVVSDYVGRPNLEAHLLKLLLDDKRSIVTLVGRGGIGKTSLALKVIQELYRETRYDVIVWLSARDVDLQFTGPKPVRPLVLSPEDMSKFYAGLVLPSERISTKGFNARSFFEQQLQKCDLGRCLFVFDNFETTQNPVEIYNWIDAFIRLPNKALITTRLREFKGDYPVEVSGMEEEEARLLVAQTAASLGISNLIDAEYVSKLVDQSEGHPYVIKILLGEVAKVRRAANIPQLVAGTEDILTALFERTYVALSPCSQRAFLTLSAWNSPVPRLALEAVLFRSTEERNEVEKGIESLLQYSMAEMHVAPMDRQEFISLEWFGGLNYAVGYGPHLALGEPAAERDSFGDVVLVGHLLVGREAATHPVAGTKNRNPDNNPDTLSGFWRLRPRLFQSKIGKTKANQGSADWQSADSACQRPVRASFPPSFHGRFASSGVRASPNQSDLCRHFVGHDFRYEPK